MWNSLHSLLLFVILLLLFLCFHHHQQSSSLNKFMFMFIFFSLSLFFRSFFFFIFSLTITIESHWNWFLNIILLFHRIIIIIRKRTRRANISNVSSYRLRLVRGKVCTIFWTARPGSLSSSNQSNIRLQEYTLGSQSVSRR